MNFVRLFCGSRLISLGIFVFVKVESFVLSFESNFDVCVSEKSWYILESTIWRFVTAKILA